jgi:hypothetical protein
MNVLPLGEQQRLLLDNDPHGATGLAARHAIGPDQIRGAVGAQQIDLGLTVAENVDVHRWVIIHEN